MGFGSLQGAGGSVSARPGAVKAGARLSVARSLPFISQRCPDYWRLKGESRVTVPFPALQKRQQSSQLAAAMVSTARQLPRWRRIGVPAHAYTSDQLMKTVERSPLLADLGNVLRRSTMSFKGRTTLAADSMPAYETEALGGDSAVRGYEEHELGRAHSSAGATAEIMLPLNGEAEAQPVGLALFTDVGVGAVRLAGTGEMEKRAGSCVGFGVRYGPFRIDYAFNRAGRRRVHVTLVQD